MKKLKIVIVTGIYPPAIGGPAQYAKHLKKEFERLGYSVTLLTYRVENYLPTLVRHLLFFLRLLSHLPGTNLILALDTFSVGLPAAWAARLTGKRLIIRVGGDFLWEQYVERTGDLVLLRKFYQITRSRWSVKEKLIFRLTRWLLKQGTIVFSTAWQKDIWQEPYQLDRPKCRVIENYYGPRDPSLAPQGKIFMASGRPLKLRNLTRLRRVFALAQKLLPELVLVDQPLPYGLFLEKLKTSYAVLAVSITDISPNLVLEALRLGKPVILTRETGILDRVGAVVLTVDPEDERDITDKILWLAEEKNYQTILDKVKNFSFSHTYQQITQEFLALV